jgi:predicted Zn-dependent protease
VVNSKGVRVHHPDTAVELSIVMMQGGGSATVGRPGWRLDDLDARSTARTVAERAARADHPVDVEPGDYPVVLEPAAVGVLLKFLAYLGFSGKAYHEKRSFMWGKLGLRVTGDLITIADDAFETCLTPRPFDYEGVPKRRVTLIDRGVAAGVVHDTASAAAERTTSTGHALPANSSFGAMPLHLAMAAGESDLDAMIASTGRGLLVCNFHYANVAERMKTVVTGMTRFGLFLIEDGKVAQPVKNLRFTQSVLEAFESASALSSERRVVPGFGGGMLVPAMRCDAFTFSGKTEF